MINNVSFQNVKLLPGLFKERADINRSYLMELSNQGLLQNFYLEAGVILPNLQIVEDPSNTALHWGWEAPICQLRGHFLGHWLSAASMQYASTGDRELKARIDVIVDELKRCQDLNGGEWVGSIPEKYFKILEKGEYIWSPQYTMHKTILGLFHAYFYTGNKVAPEILSSLTNWYIKWTDRLEKENSDAYLKGEAAGMLEMWAALYEEFKDEKYLILANRYAKLSMFEELYEGKDSLTDMHTNASIPSAHGAAKMYEITGDEKWLTIVKEFWKCAVTNRGMYATTGQNAGEFWIPPYQNGKYLGNRSQEFCTVYNMVRLADYLYKFTGEVEYMNYIEKCLYNGFLAQHNKHTGMPTYFLPMLPGSKKKWGSKRHDFWCCHGTTVQAQALYPSICYYQKNDDIYINQFIPSQAKVSVNDNEIALCMVTNMKFYDATALFDEDNSGVNSRWSMKVTVKAENVKAKINIRVPQWTGEDIYISLNGRKLPADVKDGYICIENTWKDDEIAFIFTPSLELEKLPDVDLYALKEGPIVLASVSDKDNGLKVDGELSDILIPFVEHTYETYPWQQSTYRTIKQSVNMEIKPLYDIIDEPYTIYHTVTK